MIRRQLAFALLSLWLPILNAFAESRETAAPAPAIDDRIMQPPAAKVLRKVVAEGETFVLRSSSSSQGVETEEYSLEGQSRDSWTELITCQRILLPEALNADEYVGLLKQRLQTSNPTAHLRVLQTHPRAAVFGIEYRAEDVREIQLTFVLVTTLGVNHSREIQLIQYAMRPGCMDPAQIEPHAKRWQARFQSQAMFAQAKETAMAASTLLR